MASKPFDSIKKNSEFIELKENGRRFWASPWMLVSVKKDNKTSKRAQVGMVLSRKVGSAVVRNKIKRWIRSEITKFLIENPEIKPTASIFIKPMGPDYYKKLEFQRFKKVLDNGIKFIKNA